MHSILPSEFSDQFNIDPVTGIINTSNVFNIDREASSEVEFEVMVRSDTVLVGNQSGPVLIEPFAFDQVRVVVTILDVNDNAPVFTCGAECSARISEDAIIGTSVTPAFVMVATDDDLGQNSQVVYTIKSGGDGKFKVNHTTGAIFLSGTVDREATETYHVTITATDLGTPLSQETDAVVIISLDDVNDEVPYFIDAPYLATIPEHTAARTTVLQVVALDDDRDENAKLVYSIEPLLEANSGFFAIVPETGEVQTTVKELDRELVGSHTLVVTVTDSGTPPQSTQSSIEITVADINDNNPVFDPASPTAVAIFEDKAPGTTLGQLLATDSDIGDNARLAYTLVNVTGAECEGNPSACSTGGSGRFSVSADGLVSVGAMGLDREQGDIYTLTAAASDSGPGGGRRALTAITVQVRDVNDNDPVIVAVADQTVVESSAVGTPIVTVVATDQDIGKNQKITYSITAGNIGDAFRMNEETGEITVARASIDYENLASYLLTITAVDAGSPPRSTSDIVTIAVADINDNAPQFVNPIDAVYHVSEDTAVGADVVVALVEATDEDSGEFQLINFAVLGAPEDTGVPVRINPITGAVSLIKRLVRLLPNYNYRIL